MALTAQSLFLYDFEVGTTNFAIDFRIVGAGPILEASVALKFYSLTSVLAAVKAAMEAADPSNVYTVTADRTVAGGTENRVTISTSGAFLELLFATGPRSASTIAPLLGYTATDKTGATSYAGTVTAGTALISELVGYNFTPAAMSQKVFGNVNISTSGKKEAIIFNTQKFPLVEFKYEPSTKVETEWQTLNQWMMKQRSFDFTPEITSPSTFFEATLETHVGDGRGLGFTMREMLPNFPNHWTTGIMKFRVNNP